MMVFPERISNALENGLVNSSKLSVAKERTVEATPFTRASLGAQRNTILLDLKATTPTSTKSVHRLKKLRSPTRSTPRETVNLERTSSALANGRTSRISKTSVMQERTVEALPFTKANHGALRNTVLLDPRVISPTSTRSTPKLYESELHALLA
jgi:hypothetical protein